MNKIRGIVLEDSKTIDHSLNSTPDPKRKNGVDQSCEVLNQELFEDDYGYESDATEDDEEEGPLIEQYAKVILFGPL